MNQSRWTEQGRLHKERENPRVRSRHGLSRRGGGGNWVACYLVVGKTRTRCLRRSTQSGGQKACNIGSRSKISIFYFVMKVTITTSPTPHATLLRLQRSALTVNRAATRSTDVLSRQEFRQANIYFERGMRERTSEQSDLDLQRGEHLCKFKIRHQINVLLSSFHYHCVRGPSPWTPHA